MYEKNYNIVLFYFCGKIRNIYTIFSPSSFPCENSFCVIFPSLYIGIKNS